MSVVRDIVGNTPLVELRNVTPPQNCGRVFLKLEFYNPTGSYKDRMALAMLEKAEERGDLKKGMKVVEFTGGSTGISLSFACALKGYQCHIVSNDVVAAEKIQSMRIFGATVELLKSSQAGKLTPDIVPKMMARAREITEEENQNGAGAYWTNQLSNRDMLFGYEPLGREIIQQLGGRLPNVFCACTGTSGMLMGAGRVLKNYEKEQQEKEQQNSIQLIAFEPSTSPVLSGGIASSHSVEGVAPGFIPPLYDATIVSQVRTISEEEGRHMCLRLAREEGILAGTSTGLNVIGALQLAQEIGPGGIVVTVAPDSGLKYLTGSLFQSVTQ
jgi:cysteine synthase